MEEEQWKNNGVGEGATKLGPWPIVSWTTGTQSHFGAHIDTEKFVQSLKMIIFWLLALIGILVTTQYSISTFAEKGAIDNSALHLDITPLQLDMAQNIFGVRNKNMSSSNSMNAPEGPASPGKWLDCEDAPDEWRKRTCLKLRQIDRKARQVLSRRANQRIAPPGGQPMLIRPIPVGPNTRGQVATHPFECMTLQCLCPFFRGKMRRDGLCHLPPDGRPLSVAYRKEYRMLSDDERRRFHGAMNELKRQGVYRFFAAQHRRVADAGAHSGPAFLPWHREFVKRFEIALRLIDPGLAVPYWDSVMDNYLPDSRDSMFFSPLFAGDTDPDGFVDNGPFAFWRTLEGRNTIWRRPGRDAQLFTERQLNAVASEPNIWNVLSYTVPFRQCPIPTNFDALEYSHTNIHFWVGGDLATPELSANDPIFYLHHSFVDLIFEIWRQNQQSRWARENVYTANLRSCANDFHFSHAVMAPFNTLTNLDGLSNAYTDQLYRYALRPTCSSSRPTCGSKYLFCDLNHGIPHCVAKLKFGGNCRGFEGMDACFNGQCIWSRCQPGPTPPPWTPPAPTSPAPSRLVPMAPFRSRGAAANKRRRIKAGRRRVLAKGRRIVVHAVQTEASGEQNTGQFSLMQNITMEQKNNMTMMPEAMETAEDPFAMELPEMPLFNFVDCFNKHPCCEHWADEEECARNPEYMSRFCRSACRLCEPAYNRTDECADRHVSCEQWATEGECTGTSSAFLAENCRKSCGVCAVPKFDGSCSTHMTNLFA